MFNMLTPEQETQDRNYILNNLYGKIPSYAVWYSDAILKQAVSERIIWWKSFMKSENSNIKELSKKWLNYYN